MTNPPLSRQDQGSRVSQATTCWAVLLAIAVVTAASGGLHAQSTTKARSSSLSLSAGPAAINESYRSTSGSTYGGWYEGVSLGAKLTLPLTASLGAMVHASAFRAPDGITSEWATAGLELRLGRNRQIPLSLAAGVVREPGSGVCHMVCSPIRHDTAPTMAASIGYLARAGKLELGPEFTWTRAFEEGIRYHSLHLGLRIVTGL